MVKKPTRGPNILDLFMTNHLSLVNKVETLPGISDHEAVFVNTDLKAPAAVKQTPERKVYLYHKGDFEGLRDHMSQFKDQFLEKDHRNTTVDDVWKEFRNELQATTSKYIPSKMTSRSSKHLPWINKDLQRLIRKRNKLYQKHKSSGDQKDKVH
jgi:hypothetical protein